MNFTYLNLKPEYRSFQDDIINDFYVPVLSKSVIYKRAVGYFSSSGLIGILQGVKGLIDNGGKIQIIASPQLTEDDIEAIKDGYKDREEIVKNCIIRNIEIDTEDTMKRKQLNILAYLISNNLLDIKLAFIETNNNFGMYHEKIGIVKDEYGNTITFNGSINETKSALSYNYESFDVFCSWKNEVERTESKVIAFEKLWNDEMNELSIVEFPQIAKDILERFIFEEPDYTVVDSSQSLHEEPEEYIKENTGPKIPREIELREYQADAIKKWEENNHVGIFDMATGTGKTITGLSAASTLYKTNKKLAIVIVCPYQHLVEQWVEDIELFNMKPIIGYSASKQRTWRESLKLSIDAYNYKHIDNFCFITTNATFSSIKVQKELKKINSDLLIIIDEAHNFGARHLAKTLLHNAEYRLALSATINRHNDTEGTQKIFDYFDKICLEYTLEDAINSGMLTSYEYYPVPVYLSEEELERYRALTAEISKRITKDKFGKVSFKESAKHFLIQRARVIAGAKNKLDVLKSEMRDKKNEDNILVYCGATTIIDDDYEEGSPLAEERRQIDAVTNILGNELGMSVAKFTSEEDTYERESLKERFANNDHLQALIAIRCLDEGVDIPSVRTAFILASSTNPKEYIQRRGRVLRLHENKEKAVIYDFITLPAPLEELEFLSDGELKTYRGLIIREITRMMDFANIALNSSETDSLIYDLMRKFNITIEELEGEENKDD